MISYTRWIQGKILYKYVKEKIKEVNLWLKETIVIIEQKDPNAIIIVLADHGGWVGLESYDEMFRTEDEK